MPSGTLLSNLNTASSNALRTSVRLQSGRPGNSIEVLLKQGRTKFGNFGLHHCSSIWTLAGHLNVQPVGVGSLTTNCRSGYRRHHSFVPGTLSQIRSSLFVTEPPCQAFEYPRNCAYPIAMATSGSKAAGGDIVVDNFISGCASFSNFVKPTGVYFNDRSLPNCRKARLGLRSRERINNQIISACCMLHTTQRFGNSNSLVPRISSSQCHSDAAVPDVSTDGSAYEEQLGNSVISSYQNIIGDRTLKLQSGSCYLPHPDKETTGGEDAHFICGDKQVIGVADGVGGWADVGVDAGEYARELMSHSVEAIEDEPKGSIDPARVLEKAHSLTKAMGSSTACIIALTSQGLHAINLGDSGFIIIREGCPIFQSPVQQYSFNFPYQLERSNRADLPSSGQIFTIPVEPGDVIVAGTDGLFDNLYSNEITAIVVLGMREGLGPEVTAQKIAALARERALDRHRQTPFSAAAQEAGFRYYGGKLDDTTVVVSYVTSSTNM